MDSFFERCIDFHANLHPVVKWGGYLVLAAGLSATALPPTYKAFRGWRMDRNLDKAESALAEGRTTQARDLALAVVRFSPQRMEAMRVLAASVYSLREPAAQDIACMMLGNPASNDDDKIRAFQILAERSPMALVGAAWSHLGQDRQRLPEFRLPFVRRLIEQSHFKEAAGLIQQIPEAERPPALEAEWIRLLALSQEKDHQAEAQKRSLGFFEKNLPGTGEVAGFLSALPLEAIESATTDAATTWLAGQTAADATTRLAVARLRYATDPPNRDAIAAESTRQFLDSAPGPLCLWLTALNRTDEALALTPPATFATDPAWFAARNALLAKTENWKDWLANLDQAPAGVPRMELSCDRAIAALKLGDHGRSGMEWSNALAEASSDTTRNGYLILAARAEAAGMSDQAIAAMSQAVRIGRGTIPIHERLQPLIRALASRGRGRELLQIFSTLMQFEGSNPLVVVNYCYLGSLYGMIEPDFTIARMEELRKAMPQAVPVRAVLATGWLMKEQPAKAAEVMEIPDFDWATAAPGYRAVYGTTMFLLGKSEESARVLQGLPWNDLLPRETNVFLGILSKARARSGDQSTPPWLPDFQTRSESDTTESLPASPPKPALPAQP